MMIPGLQAVQEGAWEPGLAIWMGRSGGI